ncbi:LOW QUALITY PROTEIN: ZW10 interactor [Sorex fumeus]|uniref:LOW QUALITY PROTEIN: ZW10 interactor n=1 Tax=Sorex fumeus TaxID=62283 RepID=UPI0024AE53BC|nr:LOW QUALITY PROTEIN: ZW10 interactor [Sorex fumeus]
MEAESAAEAAARDALAQVTDVVSEPRGPQEEAELPAQILAEFVVDARKKDKLLCSQLQVVDFLQNFLTQEDAVQGLDPMASEDTSRQKATEAKGQWKELKATYHEHVENITSALSQVLSKVEETQAKRVQLQEALEQLEAKKQVAVKKRREAQKQWRLQQEKHLQCLAEVSAEVRQCQERSQQALKRLEEEVETMKQKAVQEQDKLQRHQTFLQLLSVLQGKPLSLESEKETAPQEENLPDLAPCEECQRHYGKDWEMFCKFKEKWGR